MSQILVTGEAKVRDIQGPVVANSGVITALDGDASQYVRGDGTLADFPTSTGGGSSVSYYLNSSVSQGTIGGVAYRQLSKTPISGAGTDITASTNGYIASYLTDANDPALLEVPAGNFNCEFYFSVNSNAHNPYIYAEVYKYDGTTFTLIGSSQSVPEYLTNGTTLSPYYFAIPVAQTVLAITDRIAIRIYVNVDGRTVTLHTENNHLCQVVTTFSKGLTSLNNLIRQVQFFGTGTSGTDFNISSVTATHTFNLPVASATNTGKLSSTDWSTFNNKVPYTGAIANVDLDNYDLSSKYLNANGTSGLGGVLNIKQDATYLAKGNGYSSIASSSVLFDFFGYTGVSTYKNFALRFDSLTNNTQRTFTLPDLSGTLALLEGTQTFTGVKTFIDNPIINGTGTNSAYTILQSAGTNKWRIGNNYASGVNTFDIFAYDNSSTPLSINSNGAMTLSANVTTTGAQFVQNGFYLSNANAGARAFYTLMWGSDNGINFALRNGTGGASFIFQSATGYNYTFPAATGTLALTSQLTGGTVTSVAALTIGTTGTNITSSVANSTTTPVITLNIPNSSATNRGALTAADWITFSNKQDALNGTGFVKAIGTDVFYDNTSYLPLTGGTLTGALSGTSATFSGGVSADVGSAIPSIQVKNVSTDAPFIGFYRGGTLRNTLQLLTDGSFRLTDASLVANAGLTMGVLTASSLSRIGDVFIGGRSGTYASYTDGVFGDNLHLGATASGGAVYINTALSRNLIINPVGGNVGIGTSSPSRNLVIQNSSTVVLASLVANPANIAYLLFGDTDSDAQGRVQYNNADDSLQLFTDSNERLRITSGGNVLIGNTSSVGSKLIVKGSGTSSGGYACILWDSNSNDLFWVRNDGLVSTGTRANSPYNNTTGAGANAIFASDGTLQRSTSSLKYKTDVRDYDKGLAEVMQIRPVYYKGKGENDGDKQYAGLIAEEIHDLGLTEFVQYAEDGTPDALAYSNMIALAFKAIQEQQAQIEELKELIKNK